jgi:hypothetical protein
VFVLLVKDVTGDASLLLFAIAIITEYISLVVGATVKTGIICQVEAFKAGFNQVISFFF